MAAMERGDAAQQPGDGEAAGAGALSDDAWGARHDWVARVLCDAFGGAIRRDLIPEDEDEDEDGDGDGGQGGAIASLAALQRQMRRDPAFLGAALRLWLRRAGNDADAGRLLQAATDAVLRG